MNQTMNKLLFLIFPLLLISQVSIAQGGGEKGKIQNAPKIPQNKKNTPNTKPNTETKANDDFDFIYEDQPKLRFSTQYENKESAPKKVSDAKNNELEGIRIEPIREINELVHEDTSSLDDGELLTVEIVEQAMFNGAADMTIVSSHFDTWDTRNLDPYQKDPKAFDQIIPIQLYDETSGRKWSPVLDKSVITSHFGWRSRRWHKGTDLDLVTGDKVYAAFDGVVRIAGVHSGYGRTVLIRHYNGLETLYGHLSSIAFEPGTIVRAGDEIGLGGNTGRSSGSHLHYETRFEGNQFDPENIYNFRANPMELTTKEFLISAKVFDYLRGRASKPINVSNDYGNTAELNGSSNETDDFELDEEEDLPISTDKIIYYTTQPGDNLTEISRKFNTSVAEICTLNKISSSKKLFVGLKIRVR